MNELIAIKIKVEDIDKTALYQGKQGKYLDLVMIPTPDNQYGNTHMVVQGLPKERRETGERGRILGNAKPLGPGGPRRGGGANSHAPEPPPVSGPVQKLPPLADDLKDEEIPF